MSDHEKMSLDSFNEGWSEDLSPEEMELQRDLSCLVDGELDEAAAARVMVRMDESSVCQAFFEDARRYVRFHRDLADPERVEARLACLSGLASPDFVRAEAEQLDLNHRLATIFYQLGKAHVLAGLDLDSFRERVFESAVAVDDTRSRGRGFVDGVILGGRAPRSGVDWREARHLLNGRLERIEEPLEKGRRLLQQAIETDPAHEESKIYLAYLLGHEGKTMRAAELYREVFETALGEENRGHAANQLGRLHNAEENWQKAIACWRWLTISGLADVDQRFWMARLNIAIAYTYAGDRGRALDYFRRLLDAHPGHAQDVAKVVATTPKLQAAIESQPGFPAALMERCPEMFGETSIQDGMSPGEVN